MKEDGDLTFCYLGFPDITTKSVDNIIGSVNISHQFCRALVTIPGTCDENLSVKPASVSFDFDRPHDIFLTIICHCS